jgi:hypothetical protein
VTGHVTKAFLRGQLALTEATEFRIRTHIDYAANGFEMATDQTWIEELESENEESDIELDECLLEEVDEIEV